MKTILIALLILTTSVLFAQDSIVINSTNYSETSLKNEWEKKNIVKLNVGALFFRNFQFAYERSITKRLSAVASLGFIPNGNVPFMDSFIDEEDGIKNAEIGGTNFTLEARFYLGKGYGRGFYIAPYYRYSKFNIDNLVYEAEMDGEEYTFSGSTKSNNVGLLLGVQTTLGKSEKFILDIWVLGGHYGKGKGELTGIGPYTLTAEEQAILAQELDENLLADIDYIDYKLTPTSNGAIAKIDGPWAGLRFGISFGYRF